MSNVDSKYSRKLNRAKLRRAKISMIPEILENLADDAEWWFDKNLKLPNVTLLNDYVYRPLGICHDHKSDPIKIMTVSGISIFSLLCLEYIKTDGMP